MSEKPTQTSSAQRALELKRAAAARGGPNAEAGRKQALTAAADRSASKSKPWMKR